jgi:hypothetical protein
LHVARAIDRLPDANAANPELAHCVCRLQTGVLPPVCCSAMTSTVAGAWAKPERTLNPRRTSAALPMRHCRCREGRTMSASPKPAPSE